RPPAGGADAEPGGARADTRVAGAHRAPARWPETEGAHRFPAGSVRGADPCAGGRAHGHLPAFGGAPCRRCPVPLLPAALRRMS
ncbi:Uncharacterized protein APZ42_003209, partial [Daphnia magna]